MQRAEGLNSALVLMLIAEKPRYGYELMKKVEEISGGYWQPGQGTVYGTLDNLEEEGLIQPVDSSENTSSDRNYFGLTDKGRKEIEKVKQNLDSNVKPLERILGLLHVYKYFFEEDFMKTLEGINSEFAMEINSVRRENNG